MIYCFCLFPKYNICREGYYLNNFYLLSNLEVRNIMAENQHSVMTSSDKIKQLERLAADGEVSIDSASLKNKLSAFLIAHADKVMDTVAPLEALRDLLTEEYIAKAQETLDDPELSTGKLAGMISDIQNMNLYAIDSLKKIVDADKLQAYININASDNSKTQVNVLNLDNAQSRARVLKAVSEISRIVAQSSDATEIKEDEEQ